MIGPGKLDFGEVWETDQFEWSVPIHNKSSAPIQATSRTSSCSCVTPSATALVPPGATADLKLRIDLRNPCAAIEPQATRDVAIKVYVGSDTAGVPTVVELRGLVRSALAVGARMVDLGRTPAGSPPKTRSVPVRSLMSLRELNATADDDTVRVELISTDPGKWNLRLTAASKLRAGTYKTTVRLHPVLASGEQPTPINLPVEFEMLGDVQPDSPAVVLGAHPVGSTTESQITLRSLTGRAFTIDKWTAEPAGSVDVVAAGADSASRWFTLRQKVTTSGDRSARVWFVGKDADGRAVEVVIDVRYYGLGSSE